MSEKSQHVCRLPSQKSTQLDRAVSESKQLAAWAPGLKQTVAKSLSCIGVGGRPQVKTLKNGTNWSWYQHILNDTFLTGGIAANVCVLEGIDQDFASSSQELLQCQLT